MDTPSPDTAETAPQARDLVDYLIATVRNQGSEWVELGDGEISPS